MALAQVQQEVVEDPPTSSLLTVVEVGDMGYCLALFGVTELQTYFGSLQRTAQSLLQQPGGLITGDFSTLLASFSTLKHVVRFTELDGFEASYYTACNEKKPR